MRRISLIVLFLVASATAFASKGEASRILVHTLNYLGQDYKNAVKDGKVINEDEYEEMTEFCEHGEKYFKEFSADWSDADSIAVDSLIEDLVTLVKNKADYEIVAKKSQEAKMKIIAITGLKTFPSHYPDLEAGKKLFIEQCAKCHGNAGFGDGPEGLTLDPKPRNFHDNERLKFISPAHAFNTIRLGVEGTGMRSHVGLEDDEVWNLAFYVISLRYPNADFDNNKELLQKISLEKIAVSSDVELAKEYGIDSNQLAAIRLNRPHPSNDLFLKTALEYLDRANLYYTNARGADALQSASLAYLQGIEPIELQLKATDPELSEKLEKQIQRIRKLINENRPIAEVNDSINAAKQTIHEVSAVLEKKEYSFWLSFLMSISILLREGLEAFLVIMVILSVLKAANIPNAPRWVHAGWITAVLCGLVIWFVGSKLIPDGSSMELIEASISILAVVMLLYVGFWLHGKSEAGRWKEYVSRLVKNAVSEGSLWGLASLSFFVVFREVFESVVFLSSLNIESGGKQSQAIALGVLIAFLLVFTLAFVVLRFSAKLPIPQLFKISSIVMAVLAVVLAGKGIHSFQEIGYVPIHGLSVSRIELLGIFPTVETCLTQLAVLVIVILVWNLAGRKPTAKPAA
ncbi:MAG: FTR1 family protein [Chitinophagales bacterium]